MKQQAREHQKSPIFRSDQIDELCAWAANNCTVFANIKANKEEWKQMLIDDFVYAKRGNVIFI